jgi:hypothetical protein
MRFAWTSPASPTSPKSRTTWAFPSVASRIETCGRGAIVGIIPRWIVQGTMRAAPFEVGENVGKQFHVGVLGGADRHHRAEVERDRNPGHARPTKLPAAAV